VKIRIAGNTGAPCYFVIKSKGYEIEMITYLDDNDEYDCTYEYKAIKDNLLFSAISLEELLGLITMWEHRGDNWQTTKEEYSFFENIRDKSPTCDKDGNIVLEGD